MSSRSLCLARCLPVGGLAVSGKRALPVALAGVLLLSLMGGSLPGCAASNPRRDCGNGILDPLEICDDGNWEAGDGCDRDCKIEQGFSCFGVPSVCETGCGDGDVAGQEECDDGNLLPGDGCSPSCGVEPGWACSGEPSLCVTLCGNGQIDTGEECDGADLGGATCTSVPGGYTGGELACSPGCQYDTVGCQLPGCGNGQVDAGEECDDGNSNNTDSCLSNCTLARCGDGYVWSGAEECDDGNSVDSDACLSDCTSAHCGDGHVWSNNEQCDDGNTSNTDACLNDCTSARCGDGYIWTANETCDDGNTTAGDGCSSSCTEESLQVIWSISSLGAGWSQTPITYAGDPHAPTQPILAAANVDQRAEAYVFTSSTFHVLSLPGLQWVDSGPLSSRFSGLPGPDIKAAKGVSWAGQTESGLHVMVGAFSYVYHVTNSTGAVAPDTANPITTGWCGNAGEPSCNTLEARWLDLDNSQGWLSCDPNALCGGGPTELGPNAVTIDPNGTLYYKDVSVCYEPCGSMPLGSHPPFGLSPRPAASKIEAAFYMTSSATLYVITSP